MWTLRGVQKTKCVNEKKNIQDMSSVVSQWAIICDTPLCSDRSDIERWRHAGVTVATSVFGFDRVSLASFDVWPSVHQWCAAEIEEMRVESECSDGSR